jgi:hypothetical protein
MFEIFFMFTIIFVAYVIYHMFNELKEVPTPVPSALKTKHDAPAVLTTKPKSVSKSAVAMVTPTASPAPKAATQSKKPAAIKPATIKKTTVTAAAKSTENKKGLLDPKTGEVTTSYNNYRFTKRWIKDALVSEGLLTKVYKNNELEPAIEATIKAAIVKLEALEKYKP